LCPAAMRARTRQGLPPLHAKIRGVSPLESTDDKSAPASINNSAATNSEEGGGGGGGGGDAVGKKRRAATAAATAAAAAKGAFLIELKYPWMHPSLLNVSLLRVASRSEPLKRLWWLKWEAGWAAVDGGLGQLYVQSRVDVLDASTWLYAESWAPKLRADRRSKWKQALAKVLVKRGKKSLQKADRMRLLLRKPRKKSKRKEEASKKGEELAKMLEGTSIADITAAKDKRKEGAYMGDGAQVENPWQEEVDPLSGAKLWRNVITGEISITDPKDRKKSVAEMSADEQKHHAAKELRAKQKAEAGGKKKGSRR